MRNFVQNPKMSSKLTCDDSICWFFSENQDGVPKTAFLLNFATKMCPTSLKWYKCESFDEWYITYSNCMHSDIIWGSWKTQNGRHDYKMILKLSESSLLYWVPTELNYDVNSDQFALVENLWSTHAMKMCFVNFF